MEALANWTLRHRKRIFVGWVVLFIVGAGFAGKLQDKIVPGGEAPGSSGSTKASKALERSSVPSLFLVVRWEADTPRGGRARAVASLSERVRRVQDVTGVTPFAAPPRGAGRSGQSTRVTALNVTTRRGFDGAQDVAEDLLDEREELAPPGSDLLIGGAGAYNADIKERSQTDLGRAERVGIPIVFVVLLLTFGSLWAAAVPLVIAMSALVMGFATTTVVAEFTDVSEYVQNASTMIGIALGVDYAMFLVQRVRENRGLGDDPDSAIRNAMRTTGRAVLFSGLTVMVCQATLFLIDSRAMRSVALGGVLVTFFAVATALVVGPVVIALLGDRIMPKRRRGAPDAGAPATWWHRWAERVCRRAPLWLIASTIALLALSFPVRDLSDDVNISSTIALPGESPVRQAFEVAEDEFGPGTANPLQIAVAVDGPRARETAQLRRAVRTFAGDDRVVRATALPPTRSEGGSVVPIVVTPRDGPFDESSRELVDDIRSGSLAPTLRGFAYDVGGASALARDTKDEVFGRLPLVLGVLIALVIAILFLVFRSIFLPLKAAACVLLTLGATLGALILLTQTELGSDLIGQGQPTDFLPFLPVFIISVAIALSTDYEVILISRIAEHYRRTGDNQAAIVEGLGRTGRVITSAGAVMFAVFFGFALADLPFVKQLGVGLALAVVLDATIVRAILVPAAMRVAGKWNWWTPVLSRPAPVPPDAAGEPAPALPPPAEAPVER